MADLDAKGQSNPSYSKDQRPTFPRRAAAITKSDTTRYAPAIAVYVGVTGDVVVEPEYGDGTTVTFKAVPAGQCVPCMAVRVMNTGTSATDMVALS